MCEEKKIQLGLIATARSGDKGNHANLGIVAFRRAGYDYLVQALTEKIVADYFAGLQASKVQRFELARLGALNFVLENALEGGASRSLRTDSQGKLLGTAALEIELPRPENLDDMLPPDE